MGGIDGVQNSLYAPYAITLSIAITPIKEDCTVVGKVEAAFDNLHSLAVHGAIVIARSHLDGKCRTQSRPISYETQGA